MVKNLLTFRHPIFNLKFAYQIDIHQWILSFVDVKSGKINECKDFIFDDISILLNIATCHYFYISSGQE